MTTNYLDTLARFVTKARWEALPGGVQHSAKRIFMDVLGANLLGSREPENAKLGDFFQGISGPERTSTLLRSGFPKVDRFSAAYVNGTQACAVELDDGYRYAISHAGAYVMSPCLALAEASDCSMTELLTALVVGYEVSSRISRAAKGPKVTINQHGVVNVMGAAAAAALLKGHDLEMTKETLRIAAAFAHVTSFSVLWEGATVRNLWVGAGARDGLMAAELATLGFLGLPDGIRVTIERAMPTFDEAEIERDLGDVYCVTQNHHKWYACCTGLHGGIQAALALISEHQFTADQIEEVLIGIYPPLDQYDEKRPRNTLAAKFSLAYAIPAALVCGHADHEAFHLDRIHDSTILDLVDRTTVRPDPELALGLPAVRPTSLTLLMKDGRQLVKRVKTPRGHYEDPFSDDELKEKFSSLAGRFLTTEGVAAVQDCIWNPEEPKSAGTLTDLMRAHEKTASQ